MIAERAAERSPASSMTGLERSVGRLLRVLRLLSAMTITDAAVESGLAVPRLRRLETGREVLGYADALALLKVYGLCATCFARHFRAAQARWVEEATIDPDGVEPR